MGYGLVKEVTSIRPPQAGPEWWLLADLALDASDATRRTACGYDYMSRQRRVPRSTIYRWLKKLTDAGLIAVVQHSRSPGRAGGRGSRAVYEIKIGARAMSKPTDPSESDPNRDTSVPLVSIPIGQPRPRRRPVRPPAIPATGVDRLNEEQLFAVVVRLAADQDRPITAAGEIIRAVRQHTPTTLTWNGFPIILSSRADELAAMPYPDYLESAEWQERRKVMLKLADYRCQVCNGGGLLHVHHRTYERRGNEQPRDLIVLCEGCHKLFHDNGKLAVA